MDSWTEIKIEDKTIGSGTKKDLYINEQYNGFWYKVREVSDFQSNTRRRLPKSQYDGNLSKGTTGDKREI